MPRDPNPVSIFFSDFLRAPLVGAFFICHRFLSRLMLPQVFNGRHQTRLVVLEITKAMITIRAQKPSYGPTAMVVVNMKPLPATADLTTVP
jgi:hypothetical protein